LIVRSKLFCLVLVLTAGAQISLADLEPYEDYDTSDAVWSLTTIKVAANMDDAYLEAIKSAWAAGNDVAIKLGQIEEYAILRSDLPQSGEFNLILIVKYKNTADLAPNREKYAAWIEEWGDARIDSWAEFADKDIAGMRQITGNYLMREITLKK
jgi:hypothetical protein